MKSVSKLCILFLAAFLVIGSPITDVWAQNPVTTNAGKSSGHFMDSVKKKISKFQEKMRSISQSKFAKTIGKGIEKAKGAMTWAKGKIDKAKELKKKVTDSKAYKAAMLAKKVAEETKKIQKLEKQREEEITALKTEVQIKIETLQAKLKIAKENYETGVQILEEDQQEKAQESEQETATDEEKTTTVEPEVQVEIKEVPEATEEQSAETTEEKPAGEGTKTSYGYGTLHNSTTMAFAQIGDAQVGNMLGQYKENAEEEIKDIEREIKDVKEGLESGIKEITLKIKEDIEQVKEDIEKIRDEGRSVFGSKEKQKDKEKDSEESGTPEVTAQEIKNIVTNKDASMAAKNLKGKKIGKFLDRIGSDALGTATKRVRETEDTKEEQETTTESSETMDGTSEALQPAVENLAAQLDMLYALMEGELKAIQASTYSSMASMKMREDIEASPTIDICAYSKQGVSGGGFSGLKNMVEKTVQSTTEKVSGVKNVVNEAQSMVQEATKTIQDAQKQLDDAQDLAAEAKSSITDITVVEGMN